MDADVPEFISGPTDAALLGEVAAGNGNGPLRELYRRHAASVYALGLRLLSNGGLAEELVQETFVRLWLSAGQFDPERGSAAGWIFAIARHLAVDLWRRPSSRPLDSDVTTPSGRDEAKNEAEHQVTRLVECLWVRDALGCLSDAHRQVLELSYRDHLKQAEIALRLGIPLGTVKTRHHHALRALKAALDERAFCG